MTGVMSGGGRGRPKADAGGSAMPMGHTAEYALRAMAALAMRGPDERCTGAELAQDSGVPAHYLAKVLRRLVTAGLLTAEKGHRGGFRLTRDPKLICFADILAAVDAHPAPDRCAFGWSKCDAAHPCPLHPAWSKLKQELTSWAEKTTLAQLKKRR